MKLPESWRPVRLGDVCNIGSGDGAPQEEHWFQNDGAPFIRVSDLSTSRESTRIKTSRDKLSLAAIETLRLRIWKKNSLLLPKSGASALLNQRALLGIDACVVSHLAIIEPTELIDPDYLYWWSTQFDAARVIPDQSYPSIRLQDLARVTLPLPTIPEQQRIVNMLQQAKAATVKQESRQEQLNLLLQSALERLVLSIDEGAWEPLGKLVETRYGTSVSADATAESGTPVLRIPNVMGGEVDMTDMKYVELPRAELERLRLISTDILIVRSNGNPDYVGRSAPITEEIARLEIIYASYLIRLRTDSTRLLPEYLSAFLNSAFGRAAMRNAIRTTAGQSNLSGENLTKVKLPIPPLAEQKKFRDFWLSVKELRRLMAGSETITKELRDGLSIEAMSGDLTEQWRELHATEIAEAAQARDILLRKRGARIVLESAAKGTTTAQADLTVRPTRHWLLGELSEFQRQLLAAFTKYCQQTSQPLLAEDPDLFSSFCDDELVSQHLQAFGTSLNNRIRRTLSQLAALGLIAKITLPKQNIDTGEREYLKAFRPLRETEFTRLTDMNSIRESFGISGAMNAIEG